MIINHVKPLWSTTVCSTAQMALLRNFSITELSGLIVNKSIILKESVSLLRIIVQCLVQPVKFTERLTGSVE